MVEVVKEVEEGPEPEKLPDVKKIRQERVDDDALNAGREALQFVAKEQMEGGDATPR